MPWVYLKAGEWLGYHVEAVHHSRCFEPNPILLPHVHNQISKFAELITFLDFPWVQAPGSIPILYQSKKSATSHQGTTK